MAYSPVPQTCLDALEVLLERQAFEDVTASAIINQSGVSRSSFYRYFHDKYDLVSYGLELHFETLRKRLFSGDIGLQDSTAFSLNYFYEHRNFFKRVMHFRGQNDIVNEMIRISDKMTTEFVLSLSPDAKVSDDLAFVIHSHSIAGTYCIVEWVNGGCKRSVEDQVRLMYLCRPEYLNETIAKLEGTSS